MVEERWLRWVQEWAVHMLDRARLWWQARERLQGGGLGELVRWGLAGGMVDGGVGP